MTSQPASQVVDTTTLCSSFPDLPANLVERSNLLESCVKIFSSNIDVLFIDGDEQSGKTTFLAQFAIINAATCFSTFLRATSQYAYAPDLVLKDLCNQIEWLLHGHEIADETTVDEAFFRKRILDLQRRANRERKNYYFVIDGLQEIVDSSQTAFSEIWSMLPFGLSRLKVILSGAPDRVLQPLSLAIRHKTIYLPSLSYDETCQLLQPLKLHDEKLREVHKLAKGNLARLSTIVRLIHSGEQVDRLIDQLDSRLSDLFELEWRRFDSSDQTAKLLVAIVAFGGRPRTMLELSHVLKVPQDSVKHIVETVSFLRADSASNTVSFVTEQSRKYASQQLLALKRVAIDQLIEGFTVDPSSPLALRELPDLYIQSAQYEDVLRVLSPSNLAKFLDQSQSIGPLQHQAEIGLKAASTLNRESDILSFGLQISLLESFKSVDSLRSEVEARMAADDLNTALNIANEAKTIEQRLHLMAIIAKVRRQSGKVIEEEIQQQVVNLYNQIEPDGLGEYALDIAVELVYSNAQLALELFNRAYQDSKMSDHSLDLALARFSLAEASAQKYLSADHEQITARIKDPSLKRISKAALPVIADYTFAQLRLAVEVVDGADEKMLWIREWITANRRDADAVVAVDYAVDIAIRSTAYSPNAKILRELALPLIFAKDVDRVIETLGKFDALKGSAEKIGPTIDYVALQLVVIRAYKNCGRDIRDRVLDVYYYIQGLSDIALKSACLARLLSDLKSIDESGVLEESDEISCVVQSDLKAEIDLIGSTSAAQIYAVAGVVSTLATTHFSFAMEVVQRLNDQHRRDRGYELVIKALLKVPDETLNIDNIFSAIEKIEVRSSRERMIGSVAIRLAQCDSNRELENGIKSKLALFTGIANREQRCEALSELLLALFKTPDFATSSLCAHLTMQIRVAWNEIDVTWVRIDIAYQMAERLAKVLPQTAQEYLHEADKLRKEYTLQSEAQLDAFMFSLVLLIRAFEGLLPKRIDTTQDLASLERLFDQVPSSGERAALWARVAAAFFLNDRVSDGQKVVGFHVKPLLQQVPHDESYYGDLIATIAPVLFLNNQATALEMIRPLEREWRDYAYTNICNSIFLKRYPIEGSLQYFGDGYTVTYEELVDVCTVARLIEADTAIDGVIALCVDSIARRDTRLTREQRADIVRRLNEIVHTQLPAVGFISHKGFQLVAKCKILSLDPLKPAAAQSLVDDARAIPNLADRALVLATVASSVYRRDLQIRRRLLTEAASIAKSIQVAFDRLDRLDDIAQIAYQCDDIELAKELVRIGFRESSTSEDNSFERLRRSQIDLAYMIDEEFASSLASVFDSDEVRQAARSQQLSERLTALRVRRETLNNKGAPNAKEFLGSIAEYGNAAWQATLALRHGRATSVDTSQLYPYIQLASKVDIEHGYPFYAWAIENMVSRFSKTDQAATRLNHAFLALHRVAELCLQLAAKYGRHSHQSYNFSAAKEEVSASITVKPGERSIALKYLADWFETSVRDYLIICDEYFGPRDLEVPKMLKAAGLDCDVFVLTSKKHHLQEEIHNPAEYYPAYWKKNVSEQDPPYTEIVIVGTAISQKSPIHDRWWLTVGGGLQIGTSFSSLGVSQSSSIQPLAPEDAKVKEQEVRQYLNRSKREFDNERLSSQIVTLP